MMLKSLAGIIAGNIVGIITVFGIQILSRKYYPPPKGLTRDNIDAMVDHIANLPTNAFLIMLASYLLGAFIASFIANRISNELLPFPGIVSGLFILIIAGSIFFSMKHPMWFVITTILGIILFSYIGLRLGARRKV